MNKTKEENCKRGNKNKDILKKLKVDETKRTKGITLMALIITILFSYDEKIKCSNSKGFLLQTI